LVTNEWWHTAGKRENILFQIFQERYFLKTCFDAFEFGNIQKVAF
jgi:hypothetical protein